MCQVFYGTDPRPTWPIHICWPIWPMTHDPMNHCLLWCQIAELTYKVLHDPAPRYLKPLDRVADLHGRRALRSASSSRSVVLMFQLSIQSVVGPSTFLDLGFGMDCPKTLFRRRHFQVSDADLNPSSSSSHILILSSNCTFDTIVVLAVMFIT